MMDAVLWGLSMGVSVLQLVCLWRVLTGVRTVRAQLNDMVAHFDRRHDLLHARVKLVERAHGLESHHDDTPHPRDSR